MRLIVIPILMLAALTGDAALGLSERRHLAVATFGLTPLFLLMCNYT